MRLFISSLLFVQLFLSPLGITAQPGNSTRGKVTDEKEKFLLLLKTISTDSSVVYPIARFVETEIKNTQKYLRTEARLKTVEREKAERSMVYFLNDLSLNITRQRQDMYTIAGDLYAYNRILKAILNHEQLLPLLRPLGARRTQLMASAFTQYKEAGLLNDVAIYKRVASSPQYIFQFLEAKPGFRFADSLLLEAAADDPVKFGAYPQTGKAELAGKIRNSNNPYIREIISLSDEKSAEELLPFLTQIAENKITPTEIRDQRTEALKYFQSMINMYQSARLAGGNGTSFLRPLRTAIRQKALAFYVDEINNLHDAADAIRFASVKNLRTEDIYYIITSCGEELYTSSYLGLYKRLVERFNDQPLDSLFDKVNYIDHRVFIRLAANYNVLGDFLGRLTGNKRDEILDRFVTGIETDEATALEKAMDIADSFAALDSSGNASTIMQASLQANLKRCLALQNFLGVRLYQILTDLFVQVKQKAGMKSLWAMLGDYEQLKYGALENKEKITELVLFYGDEDGISSYNNFLRFFTDKTKWKIAKNEYWVAIRSIQDTSFTVYANLPLDIKEEKDMLAQDKLVSYLMSNSMEPAVLVHRGHSYHLEKTLNRLTPSVKLAILGSCGGYNKAMSIAAINPDVQVIGSKKMGSKQINDPMLEVINETLAAKKDIVWPEIWKKLGDRFSKDASTFNMFKEYFPPSNNLGLFVLKLFNYDRSTVGYTASK